MAEKKEQKYVSDNAQLLAEWNWEKNNVLGLNPKTLTISNGRKVWWKCSKGHEWQSTVNNRKKGSGCPYCIGRKVLIGYNDLNTINLALAKEWNYEKNGSLLPEHVTVSSGKKVWWKCSKGHEWQAAIYSRSSGSGCPICTSKKVLVSYNDLQTTNPTLTKEWNYERNNGFSPEEVTSNSNKKVWWKCSEGHEWQARIAERTNGAGCPYCKNKRTLAGYNDLNTVNLALAKEWNYEKNGSLLPEHVTDSSGKKVWWKCSDGHEWQARIADRTKGAGCPYCKNKRTLAGYNDLNTVNLALAKEWNYEKNGSLLPEHVTDSSGKKVWWKCSKGHEWQAAIYSRSSGRGCPICSSEQNTSFPEYALIYYLKKCGIDFIHSYRTLGYELDVYIPSKKTAIEYDGYYWHKNKEKADLEKNYLCKNDGITLYRIREGLLSLKDSSFDYCIQKDQSDLPNAMSSIIQKVLGCNVDIDIDLNRDEIAIENLREHSEKEHSVAVVFPHLAKEWNYEKNKNLKPEHFSIHSGKKVWWICSKGHEWQAVIDSRSKGVGCPYCANRKTLKGYNDLQTINPELAKEWNYEKNNGLTPADVTPNSGKKVWWKCDRGHEWQATTNDRSRGCGCPYCSGNKVLKGYNDLTTVNPKLAQDWNYERNYKLLPENFTANSNKKVWWKCNRGHEWSAVIANRNIGRGCPICAREKRKKVKQMP